MIDGIGRSTLHSGTNPLTHTDMKTYMFRIAVNRGYKTDIYYTNAIMSKNNGALIMFVDQHDERQNESPSTVIITTNVSLITGMADII